MNKIVLFQLLFFAVAISSCDKKESGNIPECIQTIIDDFGKIESTCTTGAYVDEYNFQEKIVYVFDPGICGDDMASDVYDSNCNYLGYLGGFIGNDTINGESFSNHAIFRETIWEN